MMKVIYALIIYTPHSPPLIVLKYKQNAYHRYAFLLVLCEPILLSTE